MIQSSANIVHRTLHTLWPRGVRCGFCDGAQMEYTEADSNFVDRINEITRGLSGASEHDIPSGGESELRWVYASW